MASVWPGDWASCVRLARVKFEKYFNHKVIHMLNFNSLIFLNYNRVVIIIIIIILLLLLLIIYMLNSNSYIFIIIVSLLLLFSSSSSSSSSSDSNSIFTPPLNISSALLMYWWNVVLGSLAGAAHLSNDDAGVLRQAQWEWKSHVEQKGKSLLDSDFQSEYKLRALSTVRYDIRGRMQKAVQYFSIV